MKEYYVITIPNFNSEDSRMIIAVASTKIIAENYIQKRIEEDKEKGINIHNYYDWDYITFIG